MRMANKNTRSNELGRSNLKKETADLWKDRLSLAICLWLCSAAFIFVLAIFFFDAWVAWVSVVSSFIIILLVCMAICVR